MGKTKSLTITLAAAAFTASLFAGGCSRQEQALRARAEWPTSTPTVVAYGDSNAAQVQPPYDLQFIDWMTAHHQQAIQMAQLAVDKAQQPELKEMAQKMINDQQQEVDQMRNWRGQWFAGSPQFLGDQGGSHAGAKEHQAQQWHQTQTGQQVGQPAQAQATPVMTGSMQSDMSRLQSAGGNDFDQVFLELMIPHHQGAVQMSQNALGKAERQEIKQMAQKIIEEQLQEIAQMNQWQKTWKSPQERSKR